MPEVQYQRPALYPKQLEALFHNKRYGLIEASTKAGKTLGCIVWLNEQAILGGGSGQNYWWVAPSYSQADIAYKRLRSYLTPGTFTSNDTDLSIRLLNGAVIRFKSGELPDKLYGEDVYAAVIDEASRVRTEAWHAVRSTLTATRGPIRIIGNVKGRKNWFYDLAREAEKGDSASMHYARLVAYDAVEAGVLAAEEIEDAKRMLPESVFRELYLAQPAEDGGNPFGIAAIERCIGTLSEASPVAYGWDLAKATDWTVGIGLDARGRVCRFYRWQKSWRDTIISIIELTGATPALVDATGVGDPILEIMQREAGGNIKGFVFSAKTKQQLMEGLAVGIQQGEIAFPKGPISIELMQYEYVYSRTGVHYGIAEGEGKFDDCVCALALAWRQFKKPPQSEGLKRVLNWIPPVSIPLFAR